MCFLLWFFEFRLGVIRGAFVLGFLLSFGLCCESRGGFVGFMFILFVGPCRMCDCLWCGAACIVVILWCTLFSCCCVLLMV